MGNIIFQKTINQSEINAKYLNVDFPESFPFKKGEEFWLLGSNDEKFLATRHTNTVITGLTKWFRTNQISENTKIKLSYNENELIENKRVLHVEFSNDDNNISSSPNNDVRFAFKFESELENFIASNLKSIDEDLTLYAKQYRAGDGIIDLLCYDKEKNFVIIELKNTKTSDVVVGQIARYMGWVKENLIKDSNKKVKGLILTPEIDYKLEYAASILPNVEVKYFQFSVKFVTKEELEK